MLVMADDWYNVRSIDVSKSQHLGIMGICEWSCRCPRSVATLLSESQEFGEHVGVAASLEEIVSTKLLSSSTRFDIDTQADAQEALEFLAKSFRLLQTWCAVRGNQVQCLQRLLVEVWGLGLNHLNGHNTQGPNIDLAAILLLLDNFRCHPVGCSDHGGTLAALLGQLGTETKVGDLDIASRTKQDVV